MPGKEGCIVAREIKGCIVAREIEGYIVAREIEGYIAAREIEGYIVAREIEVRPSWWIGSGGGGTGHHCWSLSSSLKQRSIVATDVLCAYWDVIQ